MDRFSSGNNLQRMTHTALSDHLAFAPAGAAGGLPAYRQTILQPRGHRPRKRSTTGLRVLFFNVTIPMEDYTEVRNIPRYGLSAIRRARRIMEPVATLGLGWLTPAASKIISMNGRVHAVGPDRIHGSSISSARSILRRRAHFE